MFSNRSFFAVVSLLLTMQGFASMPYIDKKWQKPDAHEIVALEQQIRGKYEALKNSEITEKPASDMNDNATVDIIQRAKAMDPQGVLLKDLIEEARKARENSKAQDAQAEQKYVGEAEGYISAAAGAASAEPQPTGANKFESNGSAHDSKESAEKSFPGIEIFKFNSSSGKANPDVYEANLQLALVKHLERQMPAELDPIIDKLKKNDWLGVTNAILLEGPSGSGKTTTAQAFAKLCNLKCFVFQSSSISDEYYDSGNSNVRQIFEAIEENRVPCVVVFDEFQKLIDRHFSAHHKGNTVLDTLWTKLDRAKNVIFIGVLNEVEKIPGPIATRFGKCVIKISLPNFDQRYETLLFYINAATQYSFKAVDIKKLAQETDGFSNRSLKNLIEKSCEIASIRAGNHAITMNDCIAALEAIKKVNMRASDNNVEKDKIPDYERWLRNRNSAIMNTLGVVGTGIAFYTAVWPYLKAAKADLPQNAQSQSQEKTNAENDTAVTARLDKQHAHEAAQLDKQLASNERIAAANNEATKESAKIAAVGGVVASGVIVAERVATNPAAQKGFMEFLLQWYAPRIGAINRPNSK